MLSPSPNDIYVCAEKIVDDGIGLIGTIGLANDVAGTLMHQRDGESDEEEEAAKYDIR